MRERLTAAIIFSAALVVSFPAFAKTSDTKTVKPPNGTKAPILPGPVPTPYPNNATPNASKKSSPHAIKYRPRPGYPPLAK